MTTSVNNNTFYSELREAFNIAVTNEFLRLPERCLAKRTMFLDVLEVYAICMHEHVLPLTSFKTIKTAAYDEYQRINDIVYRYKIRMGCKVSRRHFSSVLNREGLKIMNAISRAIQTVKVYSKTIECSEVQDFCYAFSSELNDNVKNDDMDEIIHFLINIINKQN